MGRRPGRSASSAPVRRSGRYGHSDERRGGHHPHGPARPEGDRGRSVLRCRRDLRPGGGVLRPVWSGLVAAADPDRGVKVLDIACGRGACLYPALDAVGPDGSVLAIDLAAGMVEQLNAELTAKGIRNAEARVGDAEDLDLPDGWFDVVTGGFMIFFPPDPPRVLRELRRVLAPGGTLALSTFDGPAGFPWMDDIAAELFGPSPPVPSHEFDKAAVLDDALVAAGFTRPIAIEVIERFRFADVGQVEAWMRSHGGRLLLDRCDDQQLARCRELIAQNLEAHHRTADGDGYELVQRARMTVAHRA